MTAATLASGKGHRDENFPVASKLIGARHRAPIMAFYRFARAADDIADHPAASEPEKLAGLKAMADGLTGARDDEPTALALRETLHNHGLEPRHALDLIAAFTQDVTKLRYADWGELIDYCRLSAMPVGRYVLDVHGESRATWPMSDALCAALQVINHLQDCAKDYRALDRVYLPADALAAAGASIEQLAEPAASPALRQAIAAVARRTAALLDEAEGFSRAIGNRRLGVEIAVIHALARDLLARLVKRDPLSERVHHSRFEALAIAAPAAAEPGTAAMTSPADAAQAASGSSFYAGMRILPAPEREAMYAIYAFCRAVDDIADDQGGTREDRAAALRQWRLAIDALYRGGDAGLAAFLAPAKTRFGLRREDFDAVIDGMAMDVARDIRWPAMAELDLYCDRVASAVGRLAVRVFGMEDEPGKQLAHHLGRALQLTNILRDIDEDAAIGRVYLPAEALTAADIPLDDVHRVVADPRVDTAGRFLADRARAHFVDATTIMAARPRGHLIAPRLMEAAYSRLLRRMLAIGWRPPRRRVRHNKLALTWTLLRLKLAR